MTYEEKTEVWFDMLFLVSDCSMNLNDFPFDSRNKSKRYANILSWSKLFVLRVSERERKG